jgi:hypothetical protein
MPSNATRLRDIALAPTPPNRLNLDYAAEAAVVGPPPVPIIDVHSHLGGDAALRIYDRVARGYGIERTYTMTRFSEVAKVREILGDRVRFIAVPDYRGENLKHDLGRGFVEQIPKFHEAGARVVKFWAAPRSRDYAEELGDPSFMALDAPHRLEAMEVARDLGMIFMAHIADPDTWFQARYTDAGRYGTKRQQYELFETLLERFDLPWIAAHMGGWPEDLEFLTGLLDRHDNLHLDTSATKWMVRVLSRHPRSDLIEFLTRFRGRVLFGSDVVVDEEHLEEKESSHESLNGASDAAQAFDLYASRYWALRTLFESDYVGESPIADPDLAMVNPDRYGEMDAPALIGKTLPAEILRSVYHDAAAALLGD